MEEINLDLLTQQIEESQNERINITEQKYLDLALDCKNLLEEKDERINKLKNALMNYKYIFAKIFGNILMVDELIQGIDYDSNIQFAILRHALEFIISELKNLYEIEI